MALSPAVRAVLTGRRYLLRDTFTRADAGSLGTAELGGAWTKTGTGTLGIISGQAGASDATGTQYGEIDTARADVRVSFRLTTSRDTSNGSGLALRTVSASDQSTRLALHHESNASGNGSWALYQVVSGAFTRIGTWVFPNGQPNSRVWAVEVAMQGSRIQVRIDDVDRITATNTTGQTSTAQGFRISTNDTASRVDDFQVWAA